VMCVEMCGVQMLLSSSLLSDGTAFARRLWKWFESAVGREVVGRGVETRSSVNELRSHEPLPT
jgi:hypothetical protein